MSPLRPGALLLLVLLLAPALAASETILVCEKTPVEISCPDGLLIDITEALYGRVSRQPTCGRTDPNADLNCAAADALTPLENRCDATTNCEFLPNNALFGGDPCESTVKYLSLTFECVTEVPTRAPTDAPTEKPTEVPVPVETEAPESTEAPARTRNPERTRRPTPTPAPEDPVDVTPSAAPTMAPEDGGSSGGGGGAGGGNGTDSEESAEPSTDTDDGTDTDPSADASGDDTDADSSADPSADASGGDDTDADSSADPSADATGDDTDADSSADPSADATGDDTDADSSADPSADATGDDADADEDDDGDDSVCFPASSTVQLADGSLRRMDQLQVGDLIHTGHGAFHPVYFFSHAHKTAVTQFVEISAAGRTLRLSPSHYLPTERAGLSAAKTVVVGDVIHHAELGEVKVDAVRRVRAEGLYAPHTMDASALFYVDGFRVSEFTTAVHPRLARALLLPVKAAFRVGVADKLSGALATSGHSMLTAFLPSGPTSLAR